MSQSQCGRTPAKAGYPSMPWWAITLTNKLIGHRSLPEWRHSVEATFSHQDQAAQRPYPVLAPVSRSYPGLGGRLSMHYSPFRH